MKVKVVRPEEIRHGEQSQWAEWQNMDDRLSRPFLSAQLALYAGEVRSDSRVAIVEENGCVVAFWPFSVDRLGTARPIIPRYTDYQGMIHAPDWAWRWDEVLRSSGLGGWSFDHLLAYQAPPAGGSILTAASPFIDLREGWPAYKQWLRIEHKPYIRRTEAKLRRAQAAHVVTFAQHDPAPDALRTLMTLKSEQCIRNGWVDVFGPGWVRHLVERLASSDRPEFRGRVSTLRFDGQVAAVALCLDCYGFRSIWFPAFDPRWSSVSPGILLSLKLAEAAADSGIVALSFGKGPEEYKARLSQSSERLAQGAVAAPGVRGHVYRVRVQPRRTADAAFARWPGLERTARQRLQGLRRAVRHP